MELEAQECEWGAVDAESLAGACFSADRVDDAISDWDLIMALLPPGWQEQARVTGALQRRRGFAGPGNLLRVLLLHLAQGISLRQTAQAAAEGDLAQVSDVAILKRLRHCGGWFAWMTQQMAETLMMPLLRAQTQLLPGRRLCAADGSMVCGPGVGSGRWRLHYLLDLPQLCCRQVQVTSERQAESLTRFNLSPGDVVLADRGFARQRGIAHVAAAQADVIVRTKLHDPPLADAGGVPVDILALLRALPEEEIGDWPVWLQGSEGAIGLRLIAWRMPAAEARRAQEQTRRRATRKGQRIRPETLEAVSYVFLLTTLAEADAATVLALYRTRWQIELAFKRLKSLLQVGQLKKTDAGSAQAWLQGKLLLACLVEKMIAAGALFSPARKGADAPLHMAGNAVDVRRAGAGNSARLVIAAHP